MSTTDSAFIGVAPAVLAYLGAYFGAFNSAAVSAPPAVLTSGHKAAECVCACAVPWTALASAYVAGTAQNRGPGRDPRVLRVTGDAREHRFMALDTGGRTHIGEFAKWTAEQQKDEAFMLKQQRLYAKETSKKEPPQEGGKKK